MLIDDPHFVDVPVYASKPRLHDRVIPVLAALADETHISALRSVACQESEPNRAAAVAALFRLRAELPATDLDPLFEDPWFFEDTGDLSLFLLLLTNRDVLPRVLQFLDTLSPFLRGELFTQFLIHRDRAPAELLDWLYARWVTEDRLRIEQAEGENTVYVDGGRSVSLNLRIASLTRDSPHSQAVLEDYRRRPSEQANRYLRTGGFPFWEGGWETAPPELWEGEGQVAEVVASELQAFSARAAQLDLPHAALLHYMDPETLLTRLEGELRKRPALYGQYSTVQWRALELFRRWPGIACDERLQSLYLCPDSDSHLRSEIYHIMWDRAWEMSPRETRDAVRGWTSCDVGLKHMGAALLRLAEKPEPEDREFFLWAAERKDKAEFRYHAIRALDSLGEESDEWKARLLNLRCDEDACVRVAAAIALFRMGNEEQAPFLRAVTVSEADRYARMEALRFLGVVDPERALPLCCEVLLMPAPPWSEELYNRRGWEPWYNLPALEAAYQLATLGTPAAMTSLLQACLAQGDWVARVTPVDYLRMAAWRAQGSTEPLPAPHRDWRLERPWEWRCCGVP